MTTKIGKNYAIYDIAFSEIRNLDFPFDLNVRFVEFVGEGPTRDRTKRRYVFLNEGDIFSKLNLEKSIEKLNKSGLFEIISELDVSWTIDEKLKIIDISFYLKEKRKK